MSTSTSTVGRKQTIVSFVVINSRLTARATSLNTNRVLHYYIMT